MVDRIRRHRPFQMLCSAIFGVKTMSKRQRRITRREFVGTTLAAAGALAGAPALLRGRNLNDKLNIAFIACGGRANTSLNELTLTPGRPASR